MIKKFLFSLVFVGFSSSAWSQSTSVEMLQQQIIELQQQLRQLQAVNTIYVKGQSYKNREDCEAFNDQLNKVAVSGQITGYLMSSNVSCSLEGSYYYPTRHISIVPNY